MKIRQFHFVFVLPLDYDVINLRFHFFFIPVLSFKVIPVIKYLFINFYHRSALIGLSISFDYKWSMYNMEEESIEYDKAIKLCHKRSAEKLLMGCLNNGGLYVKLGQGLVSMNHILPKEYVDQLVILQDKALSMEPQDVSIEF